jgi:hypothetical protein
MLRILTNSQHSVTHALCSHTRCARALITRSRTRCLCLTYTLRSPTHWLYSRPRYAHTLAMLTHLLHSGARATLLRFTHALQVPTHLLATLTLALCSHTDYTHARAMPTHALYSDTRYIHAPAMLTRNNYTHARAEYAHTLTTLTHALCSHTDYTHARTMLTH